jgi:hypothetical protein
LAVGILGLGLIRRAVLRQQSPPVSEVGIGGGPWLIVIRSGWCPIYRNFARFGHEARVGGVSINLVGCARRVAATVLFVDAEIVLRVLVIILGGDPIVSSRCFLRQREVTLVYLGGASSDTLARAMSVESLNLLWSSRRLVRWPVSAKATARPLI